MTKKEAGAWWSTGYCPTGKRRWPTRKGAKAAQKTAAQTPMGRMVAYECEQCDGYHIGHMDYWQRTGYDRPTGDDV